MTSRPTAFSTRLRFMRPSATRALLIRTFAGFRTAASNLRSDGVVKNFRYGISANFTRNWNKVTKYNGRLKVGWVTDANGVRSYVTNIGDVSTVVDAARRTIEGRLINEYILVNTYSGDGSYLRTGP